MKISTRMLSLGVGLLASAGVLVLSLTSAPSLLGGQPTVVRLDPSDVTVTAGDDVALDVRVDDVTDLGAYEFALTFDPDVLSYVSFQNGPFLGSTGRTVTCLPALTDKDGDTVPDPGYVRVGCVTFNPPPPDGPTGSGLLATLTFGTSCAGSSDLNFDKVNLADPLAIEGEEIPAQSQGGSVTVSGGSPCAGVLIGDANGDSTINAIDAALVLQFAAGLLGSLPDAADANQDGTINAIDAALILQFGAGLLDQLPP